MPKPARLSLEVVYHEVARRLLLKQTEDAICQEMGFSRPALLGIMNRDDFKHIFYDLQSKTYAPIDQQLQLQSRNLRDEIQQACFESYDRLMSLLKTSASESIVKDVAQDMLDRGGYGKKVEDNRTVINIGVLEASILTEALKKEDEGRKLLGEKTALQLTKPVDEHANDRRNASESADS